MCDVAKSCAKINGSNNLCDTNVQLLKNVFVQITAQWFKNLNKSEDEFFVCASREKWFHIEVLHNRCERCGKPGQCWQRLVGLSTL